METDKEQTLQKLRVFSSEDLYQSLVMLSILKKKNPNQCNTQISIGMENIRTVLIEKAAESIDFATEFMMDITEEILNG